MKSPLRNITRNDLILLIFLWVFVTSFNLFKSFQIDDTFYIEEAHWISKHPLKPLSGTINWMEYGKSISTENNPVLIPYLITAVGELFGYTEFNLHLITAFFSLIAIVFLLLLFKQFNPKYYKYLLVLIVAHPIFIVNQNIMLEIPFLAIGAICFYIIFSPNSNTGSKYFILAVLFSILILIKYTAFPIIMLLGLKMFYKNEKKKIIYLFPILITVFLWSTWNIYDFGGIHLLNKKTNLGFNSDKIFTSLICLGSILTLSSIYILKGNKKLYILTLLVYFGSSILYLFELIPLNYYFYTLLVCSILIGIGALYIFILSFRNSIKDQDINSKIISSFLIFYLIFIVLTAPFMATRYFLIIFPLILILFSKINLPILWIKTATYLTVFLGILVGCSDYNYANFYAQEAKFYSLKYKNNKIKTVGHNGWQYYSKKNGMIFYDKNTTPLIKNDIIIIPSNTHNQDITIDSTFKKIETDYKKPTIIQRFIGRKNCMFGSNYMNLVPFICNNNPIDTFHIYQIK